MATFVLSLDFELFWGVLDSHTLSDYAKNVEDEWEVVPRLLAMFRRYGVRTTWATVGMLMCRDYRQWQELRPSVLPGYARPACSSYNHEELVRDHPSLFFARPLVEQIQSTPGQEIATHTYSHFYCNEPGATPEQFAADLACARTIALEYGLKYQSIVFPRNQLADRYLPILAQNGIRTYRGNADHWLYRHGNHVAGGVFGRAVRLLDTWIPVSGNRTVRQTEANGLINIPASLFLYPWRKQLDLLEPMRLARIKEVMTAAARNDGVFHLWSHPHNFGMHKERNLAFLEELLQHFAHLQEKYGMRSMSMAEFAEGNAYESRNMRNDMPAAGPVSTALSYHPCQPILKDFN